MSAWLRSVTGRAHQPSLTTPTAKAGTPKHAVRLAGLGSRIVSYGSASHPTRTERSSETGSNWTNVASEFRNRRRIPHSALRIKVDRRAETDTAQAALLIGVYSYYYLSKSS